MRKVSSATPQTPRAVVVAAQLLIFVIVCGLLYWAQFILVPIGLAVLCAFVLQPVVRFCERRRLPRTPAVVLVMALALAGVGGLGWLFGTQLYGLLSDLPEYRENIKEKFANLRGMTEGKTISGIQETVREVEEELDRESEKESPAFTRSKPKDEDAVLVRVIPEESLFNLSPAGLKPYLEIVFTVALMFILTGLFLYWREDLVERMVGLAGHTRMAVTSHALKDAGIRISRYLALQLAVNVTYGIVATTGLYLFGVPYAAVWGLFAGVLRYIPYVGSILGTLTATLAAFLFLPGWQSALYVFLFYCTMDVLVNLAEPFVFGPGLGVSVIALLLSVVVLGWLWGPVGALLATPFAVCLVLLGEYVPGLAFLSWLLGTKPGFDPSIHFYERLLRHDVEKAARILQLRDAGDISTRESIESVIVPTLDQIHTDRQEGVLTTRDGDWMGETVSDLVEELCPEPSEEPDAGKPCLMVCPPTSALDEAAVMTLAWAQADLPGSFRFSHRGRLVAEVIEDLRGGTADALLLVAMARDEKSQVRRWRRHLEEAGLDLPILVFSWSSGPAVHTPDELRENGAEAVLRGWDDLAAWAEASQETSADSATHTGEAAAHLEPDELQPAPGPAS